MNTELHKLLRVTRLSLGYSEDEMAKIFTKSRGAYRKWEDGTTKFTLEESFTIITRLCELDPQLSFKIVPTTGPKFFTSKQWHWAVVPCIIVLCFRACGEPDPSDKTALDIFLTYALPPGGIWVLTAAWVACFAYFFPLTWPLKSIKKPTAKQTNVAKALSELPKVKFRAKDPLPPDLVHWTVLLIFLTVALTVYYLRDPAAMVGENNVNSATWDLIRQIVQVDLITAALMGWALFKRSASLLRFCYQFSLLNMTAEGINSLLIGQYEDLLPLVIFYFILFQVSRKLLKMEEQEQLPYRILDIPKV